jgi:hypothetical protein
MVVAIGKRKREVTQQKPRKATHVKEHGGEDQEEQQRLKAIFQKHFEAQFKPLPVKKKAEKVEAEDIEQHKSEDEEDWEGFSEEEDGDAPVKVVEYSDARGNENEAGAIASKKELKAFLSGKVPTSSTTTIHTSRASRTADDLEDEEDKKLNLKNDLALQRLLTESHLLDNTHQNSSLEATGKNRLRALDIRMQSLGAKTSVFDGGKMPMAMRQGITAHRADKEEKRRREARENGIVLEREKRVKKFEGRRERGVGGPVVGKFKGGMLTLSKRDVRSIEGPRESSGGRKGGGKKKGRR